MGRGAYAALVPAPPVPAPVMASTVTEVVLPLAITGVCLLASLVLVLVRRTRSPRPDTPPDPASPTGPAASPTDADAPTDAPADAS